MEQVGLAAATTDVTLWSLFMEAGFVVKLVMLGLIGASIWTWAIVVDKSLKFGKVRRQLDAFEQVFWSGQSLEELYRTLSDRTTSGMGAIFVSAMREWKKSFERGARSPIGLQMRIDRAMDVTLSREAEALESRLGSLATIGSAGPFVGLFGTVVGIMTSFQAIAGSKSTNLAVVAPRYCRGASGHRNRTSRRYPGGYRLQQVLRRCRQADRSHGRVRRRILGHSFAPDR